METITSNGTDTNVVSLSQPNLRRLHRLHSRAELAQEIAQEASIQLNQAVSDVLEDAGIKPAPQDRYEFDWRNGTLSLRHQGE